MKVMISFVTTDNKKGYWRIVDTKDYEPLFDEYYWLYDGDTVFLPKDPFAEGIYTNTSKSLFAAILIYQYKHRVDDFEYPIDYIPFLAGEDGESEDFYLHIRKLPKNYAKATFDVSPKLGMTRKITLTDGISGYWEVFDISHLYEHYLEICQDRLCKIYGKKGRRLAIKMIWDQIRPGLVSCQENIFVEHCIEALKSRYDEYPPFLEGHRDYEIVMEVAS